MTKKEAYAKDLSSDEWWPKCTCCGDSEECSALADDHAEDCPRGLFIAKRNKAIEHVREQEIERLREEKDRREIRRQLEANRQNRRLIEIGKSADEGNQKALAAARLAARVAWAEYWGESLEEFDHLYDVYASAGYEIDDDNLHPLSHWLEDS